MLHALAVVGLGIEEVAKLFEGHGVSLAEQAENLQYLLGIDIVIADCSVFANVDQKVGVERVDLLVAVTFAFLAKTKDGAGFDDILLTLRELFFC